MWSWCASAPCAPHMQAAQYVELMCQSSHYTANLVVACGGVPYIVGLLDSRLPVSALLLFFLCSNVPCIAALRCAALHCTALCCDAL